MSYNGTENFKPCCNYSSLEWKCYWSCNFSSLDKVDGSVFDYNYYLWIAGGKGSLIEHYIIFIIFFLQQIQFGRFSYFLVGQMCNSSWMFIYFQLRWELCLFCWLSSTYLMLANCETLETHLEIHLEEVSYVIYSIFLHVSVGTIRFQSLVSNFPCSFIKIYSQKSFLFCTLNLILNFYNSG